MWSGIGRDHKAELYFLTNLIWYLVNFELVPCLKSWGVIIQKKLLWQYVHFLIKKKMIEKGLEMLLKFDFEPLGMKEYNL